MSLQGWPHVNHSFHGEKIEDVDVASDQNTIVMVTPFSQLAIA